MTPELPAAARTAREGGRPAPHVRVAIVGSGFAGLGMAIRLKQAGTPDFVVFERDANVGGTWWANTYPGCQCDIPSNLYSFSFAPNPDWTRTYPLQPELERYLRDCAERFGVLDNIRLSCAVTGASWDEDAGVWHVETEHGDHTADVLIAAPGALSEPKIPDIPGRDSFAGAVFHTAAWDHGKDLSGRRVAVIGTGASAIQVVPEIQPVVEHVDVYQRTPPWVVPHNDRPFTRLEKRVYRRFPALQRLARAGIYWSRELLVPGLAMQPKIMKLPERLARRHLAKQVLDPELRVRLTPDYTIGCKRILPSNKWYPALQQPNVELVTERIEAIRPHGVVTADGRERPADTIVFATGFKVTDLPLADRVRGVGGQTLGEAWKQGMRAYRGCTVPGFPNLFFLVGPNTGLGHNSMVFMIEAQINYVMEALCTGAGRIEVRCELLDAYNEHLQRRLSRSVWNTGGCSSWYLDANGNNTTIWPDFTWRFWQQTRRFDREAYELSPARRPAPVTA